MASLPPVMVGISNPMKLDSEFKKSSSPSLQSEKERYNSAKELNKAFDAQSLEYREALSFIQEGNTKVKSSSYVPLLQECIDKKSVSGAESIHALIMKTGFGQELFLMTYLINVYAKCGKMENSQKLFDNLRERNVVTWTSLMSGYVQNLHPEVATSVFEEMLQVGCYPTNYTLGIILNACSFLCDIQLGKQVHAYVVKYGIEHDASIGNALCNLYSKCCCLEMTIKAFHRIEEKNIISWTTAISACGENGESSLGLDIFIQMLDEGVEPNMFTLTSVLSLCCTMQALCTGSQIHSLSLKLGYGADLAMTTSIMYLYLKNGCISLAKKLFDKLKITNLVTWNAIIAGHAEMTSLPEKRLSAYSYGIEALKLFQRMNILGLKPDLYTFSSVLTICSSLVALEQGEQVHAQTMKTGFLSDVVVGTALVNMYNKCGSINRSSKAFVEMSNRTLISWTSMITAFAQHGRPQQALHLFEDMRFVGVKPNKVTFTSILSACSQLGMVDQAMAYFEMMKNEYNINPVMDHYSCVVDMFVRLGRIDEAFDFIKKTDIIPSEFIWSNLIAGCRRQGKLELGFYAAEQLLELKPRDSETFFLLLNMYMSAERWKDVSRVRKMMKDEKLDKLIDWSWISIRNKVYSFKTGDHKHKSGKVLEFLEDLIEKARINGYHVKTDIKMVDGEPEEITDVVSHHGEKLAVAFGLINISSPAKIRVIKSISMCRDCHNFMKIVSLLTSRTIIVRDSKHLHKFSDGQCSCGDFGRGLVL